MTVERSMVTPEEQQALRAKHEKDIRRIRKAAPPVVAVVHPPEGPPCTVLTEDGLIIHGHRVRDDYVGCTSIVVFRGWCVRAVTVDAVHGTELTTPEGRGIRIHIGNGNFEIGAGRAKSVRLKISPAEPPELPEIVRHPYPELLPWERIQHRYKRVPV